jgi:hypothetical protein
LGTLLGDATATFSPLKLKDYAIQSMDNAPLASFSDDFSGGMGSWPDPSSCSGAYQLVTENGLAALRSAGCPWVEMGGSFVQLGDDEVRSYRFSFKMRSEHADALRLGPVYTNGAGVRVRF